jgi:hypothetical protein
MLRGSIGPARLGLGLIPPRPAYLETLAQMREMRPVQPARAAPGAALRASATERNRLNGLDTAGWVAAAPRGIIKHDQLGILSQKPTALA